MAGEYIGSANVIKWGGTVISGDFRTFSHEETADEIDATAGADTRKVYLTGPVDDSISGSFIDTTGNTANWAALAIGQAGSLEWWPQGTAAGKWGYYGSAVITKRAREIPYDGVVSYDLSWRLKGSLSGTTS